MLAASPGRAAGQDVNSGTYAPPAGITTIDYLNVGPSGTVDLSTGRALIINDTVNTVWSGTITGVKDTSYIGKLGTGTVTFSNLNSPGSEIHIDGGKALLQSGTTNIFYLSVGSNIGPGQNTGTFEISGGTLNITEPGGGVSSPFPALQVGDFGGTGVVNQTGGTVNMTNASSLNIGNQGGDGTYNISGGTINFQGGFFTLGRENNSGAFPGIARPTNSKGVLNISGNALIDVSSANATMIIGNRESNSSNTTTAIVDQDGGTLRIRNGAQLFLSGHTGSASTYNLNGGTLEIGGTALQPVYAPSGGGGTYAFNLGGGTIKVIGSALNTTVNATLVSGTTSTIDTTNYDATWNGVLSGAGGLNKAGGNTLTLNAINSYTGATNINGGTLALGPTGSIAASAAVNLNAAGVKFDVSGAAPSPMLQDLSAVVGSNVVLGNNTLKFGTSNNTTIAGIIQSTGGGIVKNGSGIVTLSAHNTYTGATQISGGTVRTAISDAFANTSSLNVDNGATLDLTGAGVQHVGAYQQAAGSQLAVTLGDGHDTIAAAGAATLNGALIVHGGDGNFDPSVPYVVVSSSNLSGAFSSISDDLTFLNAHDNYNYSTDRAFLTFTKGDSFESHAETPNQSAVGGALDGLNVGNVVFDAVATHSVPDALALLDQLSGDFHATTKTCWRNRPAISPTRRTVA